MEGSGAERGMALSRLNGDCGDRHVDQACEPGLHMTLSMCMEGMGGGGGG